MTLRLAITGGTGFVGRHTLAIAQTRGHKVQALTRRPQPPMPGIEWVAGSLGDAESLARLVDGCDVVIHIAGVTNARRRRDFEAANVDGTARLCAVLGGRPLVHVSSLAARAPTLSAYGWSKRLGEAIALASGGPVVALRPPAVYGPGDHEFLTLIRMARSGVIAFPAGAATAMIHASDLARALVALAEDMAGATLSAGQVFEIDDGAHAHAPAEIAAAIGAALGRRVRAIAVPPQLLPLLAVADTLAARVRGTAPKLSRDRARYMAHPDWSADSAALLALHLWAPEIALRAGMAATVDWARAGGLL